MIFADYVKLLTEETHDSDNNVKEYIICKTDDKSMHHIIAAENVLHAFELSNHVAADKSWRNKQSTENHEIALHILNYAQEKHDECVKILKRKIIYQSRLPQPDEEKIKELQSEIKQAHKQRVDDTHDLHNNLILHTVPYATQIGNTCIKCVLHYKGPIVKPEKKKTVEEKQQSKNNVIYKNIDVWVRIIVDPAKNTIVSAHVFNLDKQFIEKINEQKEYTAQRENDDCIVTYTPVDAPATRFSLTENDFV